MNYWCFIVDFRSMRKKKILISKSGEENKNKLLDSQNWIKLGHKTLNWIETENSASNARETDFCCQFSPVANQDNYKVVSKCFMISHAS